MSRSATAARSSVGVRARHQRLREAEDAGGHGAGEHDRAEPVLAPPDAERDAGGGPQRDEERPDDLRGRRAVRSRGDDQSCDRQSDGDRRCEQAPCRLQLALGSVPTVDVRHVERGVGGRTYRTACAADRPFGVDPGRRVGAGDDIHRLQSSGFRGRWQGCHLRPLGGASITASMEVPTRFIRCAAPGPSCS